MYLDKCRSQNYFAGAAQSKYRATLIVIIGSRKAAIFIPFALSEEFCSLGEPASRDHKNQKAQHKIC